MFGLVAIDFIFLTIILISIVIGVFKGFFCELISLISFVLATYLSIKFFDDLTEMLLIKIISNRPIANFFSFLFIFVSIIVIGSILIYYSKKFFLPEALKGADRILGATFGLLRGMLICIVILLFIINFTGKSSWIRKSQTAPFFYHGMGYIMELLPKKHAQRVENFINKKEIIVKKKRKWNKKERKI